MVHVERDSNSELGLTGLPEEWEAILRSANIKKEEVVENPEAVIAAIKFVTDGATPKFVKITSLELDDYLIKDDPTTLFVDIEPIDEGAYGSVYKATDKRTNEKVAVKVMPIPGRGAHYNNVVNEIAVMHNLSDESSNAIVKYLGAYQFETDLYVCSIYDLQLTLIDCHGICCWW